MTSYEVIRTVAVISIENPPVNSLSLHVRDGILSGLKKAAKDSEVRAVVIVGGGNTFPVGADISEFSSGKAFEKPLPQVINRIEASSKPVVCAIHGNALGGGLEIALGCHYRLATSRSKVGLPEVNLGLLPGAGGTQRLPRLIGQWHAAELVCTGKPIDAVFADQKGVLDALVDLPAGGKGVSVAQERSVLLEAAIDYALSVPKDLTGRRVSELKVDPIEDFFFKQLGMQIGSAARGMKAPLQALKAVKAAGELNFAEGMQREGQLFGQLATGPQARALQHIFFAERQTTKVSGIDMSKAATVKSVGVIGAGTMGAGIAINFLKKGIPVVLIDAKQEFLDRGIKNIQGSFKSRLKKGKTTKKAVDRALKAFKPTLDYDALKDVDMVIEAVFEDMAIKKQVLKRLDEVCKPSAILCTNTSTLNIDEIASATSRPQNVVGTHFFSPADVMKLLENVRGAQSSERALATIMKLGKTIAKVPVMVGNCFGFVGNRMLFPYAAQASALLQEGCMPHDVDKVIFDFGFPMGPFQMGDLAGNDVGWHIRKEQGLIDPATRNPHERYVDTVADKLVEMKRLGLKTGLGWYKYAKGSRKGRPDKVVMDMVVEESKAAGFERRNISREEIEERCMYSLINEGFKCLEEGVVDKPGDIDIIWVYGYGFPPQRGGPMHYADEIGLKKIYSALLAYHDQDPRTPSWRPSKLLAQLAKSNQTLAKYWTKQMKRQSNL